MNEILDNDVKTLIEIAKAQAELLEELKETIGEILEKVNNLSTPGDGFGYEE